MKIIIAGAGDVGCHLARMLSGDNHEITVIESDRKLLEDVSAVADLLTVEGDCTSFATLRKAIVRKADLFIAVNHEEERNIISAILAKQMGAKKSIARIDHNEYLEPNNKEVFINLGIDYLFYPEKIAARQVIKLLGHTATTEYVDFSNGKLSLVVFRLDPASELVGHTLLSFTEKQQPLSYRTVAITRDGRTIIPHGNDTYMEGDMVYIITKEDSVKEVMAFSGQSNIDINNLMILGGSQIGQRIALELQDKVNIKLVEYIADKAYKLAETLDSTLIINEDGRNIEAMMEEGLSNMDAFVAVTGRSETNILTAMLAKRMGVKKVIAEVENLNYINLADDDADTDGSLRRQAGEQHVASVRGHINELAHTKYQDVIGRKRMDFVIMFIPNEAAYIAAMQIEPGLWQEAYDKRVLMVSPTQLISVLKMLEQLWRQDAVNKNVEEIARLAGTMLDKFTNSLADFSKVETALQAAQTAYSECRKKLSDGKGNLFVTAQKIQALGAKTTKQLPEK